MYFHLFRGATTGGSRGGMTLPPQYQTKPGPKVSVSTIRDITFYGCSEIIRTRNFTVFTVYTTIFRQSVAVFFLTI